MLLAGKYGISLEVKIRSKVAKAGLEHRYSEIGNVADLFNDKAVHTASFNTLVINLANRFGIAAGLLIYLFYLAPTITLLACLCLGLASVPMVAVNKRLLATSNFLSTSISEALNTLLLGVKNSLLLLFTGQPNKRYARHKVFRIMKMICPIFCACFLKVQYRLLRCLVCWILTLVAH